MNTPENELLLSEVFPQLNLCTPMSREQWEANQAMADKVLAYVLGEQDNKPQG